TGVMKRQVQCPLPDSNVPSTPEPLMPWRSGDAAFPAAPNGALPLAPSLTQSPWLANRTPRFGTSVCHPPCWQAFAVSLLPPLAATAGPAATALTATATAPATNTPLTRPIPQPPDSASPVRRRLNRPAPQNKPRARNHRPAARALSWSSSASA